jgi:signal transduction histidine kinase
MLDGSMKTVLLVVDVSTLVFLSRAKEDVKIQQLISAMISHEMRSPLNSILSQLLSLETKTRNLNLVSKQITKIFE